MSDREEQQPNLKRGNNTEESSTAAKRHRPNSKEESSGGNQPPGSSTCKPDQIVQAAGTSAASLAPMCSTSQPEPTELAKPAPAEPVQVEPVSAEPELTITTICYDVLERIFDFLNVQSLLHIANTCERLRIAAATKFSADYGRNRVVMCPNVFPDQTINFNDIDDEIVVNGLKYSLQLLRCFGAEIKDLSLHFGRDNGEMIERN